MTEQNNTQKILVMIKQSNTQRRLVRSIMIEQSNT